MPCSKLSTCLLVFSPNNDTVYFHCSRSLDLDFLEELWLWLSTFTILNILRNLVSPCIRPFNCQTPAHPIWYLRTVSRIVTMRNMSVLPGHFFNVLLVSAILMFALTFILQNLFIRFLFIHSFIHLFIHSFIHSFTSDFLIRSGDYA